MTGRGGKGEGRGDRALEAVDLAARPASAASVGNVAVAERPGVAEVTYDLQAAGPCVVTLVGSDDGGLTFTLRVETVEGDVGPSVAPGSGKIIRWRVSSDHPAGLAGREILLDVVAEEAAPEFTADDAAAAACLEGEFSAGCAATVEALGRRHPWFLAEALEHPDPLVKAAVAEMAGRLACREAVPALLSLLEDTPLPEGDNTVTIREKRKVQVAHSTVRERYGTVKNR